jgi:hypothetical protein
MSRAPFDPYIVLVWIAAVLLGLIVLAAAARVIL